MFHRSRTKLRDDSLKHTWTRAVFSQRRRHRNQNLVTKVLCSKCIWARHGCVSVSLDADSNANAVRQQNQRYNAKREMSQSQKKKKKNCRTDNKGRSRITVRNRITYGRPGVSLSTCCYVQRSEGHKLLCFRVNVKLSRTSKLVHVQISRSHLIHL